jgi:hypothetical protein
MSSPDPSIASEAEQDPPPLQATLAQALEQARIDLRRIRNESQAFAALAQAVEQAAQEDDDTSHGRGK